MSDHSPSVPSRQYWDSCVFIEYLTNKRPENARVVAELIRQAKAGGIQIVVSNLVLAEVWPERDAHPDAERVINEMFEPARPYMQFGGLTREIARRAREIASTFDDVHVPDAIHLATAEILKVDVFYTYDGDSRDKKRRRSRRLLQHDGKIGTPPLRIEVPQLATGPLFDSAKNLKRKGYKGL